MAIQESGESGRKQRGGPDSRGEGVDEAAGPAGRRRAGAALRAQGPRAAPQQRPRQRGRRRLLRVARAQTRKSSALLLAGRAPIRHILLLPQVIRYHVSQHITNLETIERTDLISINLTTKRPYLQSSAGNRKFCFRGSFQFITVTN